jgi:hypothetical protein
LGEKVICPLRGLMFCVGPVTFWGRRTTSEIRAHLDERSPIPRMAKDEGREVMAAGTLPGSPEDTAAATPMLASSLGEHS